MKHSSFKEELRVCPVPNSLAPQPSRQVQAAWSWLDQQRDAIAASLLRWCHQNSWSYSPQGLQAMAALLLHDFQPLGLEAAQIELPPLIKPGTRPPKPGTRLQTATEQPTGPGLLWHYRPAAPRRFLMLIHYDTVYPPADHREVQVVPGPASPLPDSAASKHGASPHRASGQRFIGPGVADAKGGIAVIRFAAQALLRFDLSGDWGWTIALNPDEEIGSPASATWLRRLAPEFEFALVFEPRLPDGAMVANRKGTGNWRYLLGGRSAHAGRNPQQGRNAVVHAARLAVELDRLNAPAKGLSVNVARIQGGTALNQVPDQAVVELNVRVVDSQQAQQVEVALQQLADRFDTAEGYSCSLQGGFHSPPKRIDERYAALHRDVEIAAGWLGQQLHWQDTGGACDGSKLAAAGLINVDTLGPIGGNLHSPEEYCEFETLLDAAKMVVNLVAIHAAQGEGKRA